MGTRSIPTLCSEEYYREQFLPAVKFMGLEETIDPIVNSLKGEGRGKELVDNFKCMPDLMREGLIKRKDFIDLVKRYYDGNDGGVLIEYLIKKSIPIEFEREVFKRALYGHIFNNDFNDTEIARYLKSKLGINDIDPVNVFGYVHNVEPVKLEEILNLYDISEKEEKIDFLRVYFIDPKISPRKKLDPKVAREILNSQGLIQDEYGNLLHVKKGTDDYIIILNNDLKFEEVFVRYKDEKGILYRKLDETEDYINGEKVTLIYGKLFRTTYELYVGKDISYLTINGSFTRVNAAKNENITTFILNNKLYLTDGNKTYKIDSGNLKIIGITDENEIVYLKHGKRKTRLYIYYPDQRSRSKVDAWKGKREVWMEEKNGDTWIGVKNEDEIYYITRNGTVYETNTKKDKKKPKGALSKKKPKPKLFGNVIKKTEIPKELNVSEYLDDILEREGELVVYETKSRKYLIKKTGNEYGIYLRKREGMELNEKKLSGEYSKVVFIMKKWRDLIFKVYDSKTKRILIKRVSLTKEVPSTSEYDLGAVELCYFLNLPKNEDGYREALRTKKAVMRGQEIKYIPRSIGRLKYLRELDLSYNQIKDIPREIGELKILRRLDLSHNQIREIPREIGKAEWLQEINLSYNRIREIPKEIVELEYLRRLDLSYNQIKDVPNEFRELEKISD